MFKTLFRLLVAALLVLAGGGSAIAQSGETSPASKKTDWLCEVDYSVLGGSGVVIVSDTIQLCTGSLSAENVKAECFAPYPEEGLPLSSSTDFAFTVDLGFCDAEDPLTGDTYVLATDQQMSAQDTDGDGIPDVVRVLAFWKVQ